MIIFTLCSSRSSWSKQNMLVKTMKIYTFNFSHDLWHFSGGAGLFFIFMFILTIDEDIRYKERSKIAVF